MKYYNVDILHIFFITNLCNLVLFNYLYINIRSAIISNKYNFIISIYYFQTIILLFY